MERFRAAVYALYEGVGSVAGIDVSSLISLADALAADGKTPVFAAIDGQPAAVIAIADTVKAGDKFQIAIFGVNGPISAAPTNFVFFRQASVEFYK